MTDLGEEEKKGHLRNLCLTDLYFLLRYGLNRSDVEHPWLFDRCREVQANPNDHIDLWSREHYKSTILTFAHTIFDVLNDPAITVCIFSHTRGIAKGFLRQIKNELEMNTFLKNLFPDILWADPKKQSPKWSEDDGLVVRRASNTKESTIEAWGLVDGQPTSKHFKLRVYDDVVTRESVTTPEQVQKTTEAWELSDNLGMEGGAVRYIGTRYSLRDTYSVMLERKVAVPRIYPATDNGRIDGKPVFLSQESWERKVRTQSRFSIASQLLQNPLADDDAVFRPEWLRSYEVRPRTLNIYIMADPSMGKSATSDNTAIAVVGVASNGAKFFLDGVCHRMSLSQRWVCLRDLYKKWSSMPGAQTVAVGYERYGAQSDLEYFEEQMRRRGEVVFAIQELNWVRDGGQSKKARVQRLEPDFRNSRFFLPITILQNGAPSTWAVDTDQESKTFREIEYKAVVGLTAAQETALNGGSADLLSRAIKKIDSDGRVYDTTVRLMTEFLFFPFGGHDDLIDATSRIYDMAPIAPVIVSKADSDPPVFWDS